MQPIKLTRREVALLIDYHQQQAVLMYEYAQYTRATYHRERMDMLKEVLSGDNIGQQKAHTGTGSVLLNSTQADMGAEEVRGSVSVQCVEASNQRSTP